MAWPLAASLALILACTLMPLPDWADANRLILVEPVDWIDASQNILLFIPLGIAFALRSTPLRWAVLFGACLSLAVESGQLWIPGRSSSLQDLVANTLGTIVGHGIVQLYGDYLRTLLRSINRRLQQLSS